MKKSKVLKINTGTDVTFCAPTHPYSSAIAAERMVEKMSKSTDSDFEVNTNSLEAVSMFHMLCPKHDISVRFNINGKPASYEEVVADFDRGLAYIYHYQNKINI